MVYGAPSLGGHYCACSHADMDMDMDMVVDMIWIYKCTHIHLREPNKFKMQILWSMGPPPWEDITVHVAIWIWVWIWR